MENIEEKKDAENTEQTLNTESDLQENEFSIAENNKESQAFSPEAEPKADVKNNKKAKGRRVWSKIFLAMVFLCLNALFVYFSVDYLLKNQYASTGIKNIQPIQVVDEQSQVIDVAKNASPAVVSIIATAEVPKYETYYRDFYNFQIPSQVQNGTEEKQIGAGSGFIVSEDGYIITNKHVVEEEGAKYTVILKNEQNEDEKIEATIIARDPNNDIAILKIDKTGLPFLNLGDSNELNIGQTTVAIGYALGEFDNTVSKGIISGLNRSISASSSYSGVENLEGLIQTDAAVNPGNSGGPLLDIAGNVIGINVAMADAQSIGFAIPINEAKSAYEEAKTSGTIKKESKAFLGVRYVNIDSTVQKANNLPYNYGAIIARGEEIADLAIVPGSPADKAGLAENDIILEVNGTKVDDDNPLAKLVGKYKPGDEIKLKIYHKGEEKEVSLKLEESK